MAEGAGQEHGRGIEGIAHLFLSGHPANHARPVRRGPGVPAGETAGAAEPDGKTEETRQDMETAERQRAVPPRRRLAGVTVIAGHLREGHQWTVEFARQWAAQVERVGLLFIEPDRGWLSVYEQGEAVAEGACEDGTADGGEGDIEGMLEEFAGECETLLVAPGAALVDEAGDLIARCRHVVVATTAAPQEMVGAYEAIRRLDQAVWEGAEVSVCVCGVSDEAEARRIHRRIGETVWEFLGMEIGWAGWPQGAAGVVRRRLGVCADGEAVLAGVIEALDRDRAVTRRDSEPEPLEAPAAISAVPSEAAGEGSADEEEAGVKSVDGGDDQSGDMKMAQAETGASRAKAEGPRVSAKQWPRPGHDMPEPCEVREAVRLRRWPGDDEELTDVLAVQMVRWAGVPGAVMVAMSLPAEGARRLHTVVDACGRVWLMGASLREGAELLTEALAARVWVLDHFGVFGQNYGQLRVDRSQPVGLILAVCSGQDTLRRACRQLGEIPIRIRQVHLVSGSGGPEAVVV
jgi:hypothetical protein